MFHFYMILSAHYDTLKLCEQKRMHNSTAYVFFLLLNTYMFLPCHLQGAYTKMPLKRTPINSLQQTYISCDVNSVP